MQHDFCHLIYHCPPSSLLPYVGCNQQIIVAVHRRLQHNDTSSTVSLKRVKLHSQLNAAPWP